MSKAAHLPAGSSARAAYDVEVTPESAGWGYSGLRVLRLAPTQSVTLHTGDTELMVLSLSGDCLVRASEEFTLRGRTSVFTGISDVVYVPRESEVEIVSDEGGRFALASARCERSLPMRHLAAGDIPVELRGAGTASRQVNNFGVPGVLEADRLIACEVLTPAGNWSSYPPHKHDQERDGESALEEIYYFEVAGGPGGPGIAYQRVYGDDVDLLAEVRDGDVVTIPFGWHGPSMAVPGYDLYYLNVMAGPGQERAWLICDDPAHGWVREEWVEQAVDPRLPLTWAGGPQDD